MTVVILLADGVRPDTLQSAIERGVTPALARLRREGGLQTITSCFPSVTGPAYTPFLMGRFPGQVGLPGIRWFDRDRTVCTFPDYTRSYIGPQVTRTNGDLHADAPTIFELCDNSLASLTPISRGLPRRNFKGRLSVRTAWRAARTHFRGDLAGWLEIDQDASNLIIEHLRREKSEFTFAAMIGIDKTSHAVGQSSPATDHALRIVDNAAAKIRADAERDGRWDSMHLWVTSDHGHSPVTTHEDLAAVIADFGFRTVAHPFVFRFRPEVAVMVSGNAMAHVYLDIRSRERPRWPDLPPRYMTLVDRLLERPSSDLAILPTAKGAHIRSARGDADLVVGCSTISYWRTSGDPLGIGTDVIDASANETYAITMDTDYPDSLLQLAKISQAARSGEIILSAARNWDLRSKHEPIPHVSAHGALHREHMLVPFLTNRRYSRGALRTTDLMPSALAILGRQIPEGLDGESFV